jgi:pimeloyl-ACP methyl ester carboxylesterase
MKPFNLHPSAEEIKLMQGAEAELIQRRKKIFIGGVAPSVRALIPAVLLILAAESFFPFQGLLGEGVAQASQKAEVKMSREKFFDTGKVKINYLDYGNSSSEPLVMLHGGAWCWEEYLSLMPSLAKRWHPYAVDFRGNGRSGWVPGQYRLEDFTEDTLAFVRQLKTPVVLVGHSMGGAVALMVAARCPEKVKGVVIEDTPVMIENYKKVVDSSREMYGTWLELKRSAQSEQELSLALADEYKNYPGVTSQWFFFFGRCLWLLDPTYFDALRYDFDGFIKGYDKQLLARIKCPVMFIRGETELGAVMSDDEISWLEKNFSNVSYTHIRGVGHLLHMQDQGQTPVLTEMLKFLERIPK